MDSQGKGEDAKFHTLLAMKTSGFGAGWMLLGRLWCTCWRGAKGTSCSHLSWCTAWGRFLSHKFFRISGFGWIGTSLPNLSLNIRTDGCCFFGSESSRFFRSTLGATSSSWRLVLWRQTSQNTIETPKGFAEDTPLRKFWIYDLDPIRQIPVDKLNPEHFLILDPKRKSYKKNLSTYFLHQKQQ